MSKELSPRILINPREGMQTPGFSLTEGQRNAQTLLKKDLPPPCQFIADKMLAFLPGLSERQDLLVELPNPISCPSAAITNKLLLLEAQKLGVCDQVAVHVRMKEEDVALAILTGAERIHLFGNSSERALNNGNGHSIKALIDKLEVFAKKASEEGVTNLRASLEHATETPLDKITLFIRAIKYLNSRIDNSPIKGIGLPDTNGKATPRQYREILNAVIPLLSSSGLTLFLHLHDDGGKAVNCISEIQKITQDGDNPVVFEAVDPYYTGERVGIRPHYNELAKLGLPTVPADLSLLEGSSWITNGQSLIDSTKRQGVLSIHTAGVHNNIKAIKNYQNGNSAFPHPGLYTIMGSGNISFLLEQLGFNCPSEADLKAAALVAREYAAQYGNQKQEMAIAFAQFFHVQPDIICSLADGFGQPKEWLNKPLPDLHILNDYLKAISLENKKPRVQFRPIKIGKTTYQRQVPIGV